MHSFCVALTGGIGVGKSTVASIFSSKGAITVNVDEVGHSVLKSGSHAYNEIVETFGEAILLNEGEIDRSSLGNIVFESPDKLAQLEAITHPSINEELNRILKEESAPVIILDMAILVEKPLAILSGKPLYRKVIVVESDMEIRLSRLLKRGLDKEEIMSRINSQANDQERREVADLIIENNNSLSDLKIKTETAWEEIQHWLEVEL